MQIKKRLKTLEYKKEKPESNSDTTKKPEPIQNGDIAEKKEATDVISKETKPLIASIIAKLESTAKRKTVIAHILFSMSLIILVLPLIALCLVLPAGNYSQVSVEVTVRIGILCLLFAALIVSISKFIFSLAKGLMVEAIRNTDRAHAIMYALVHLGAFDYRVSHEEFIQIFSNWNIDNGATLYRNQSSDEFDPKIHELLKELIGLTTKG